MRTSVLVVFAAVLAASQVVFADSANAAVATPQTASSGAAHDQLAISGPLPSPLTAVDLRVDPERSIDDASERRARRRLERTEAGPSYAGVLLSVAIFFTMGLLAGQ